MVGELAEFEHARGKAIATVADFEAALFGNNPSVFAVIAEADGVTAGIRRIFHEFFHLARKARPLPGGPLRKTCLPWTGSRGTLAIPTWHKFAWIMDTRALNGGCLIGM